MKADFTGWATKNDLECTDGLTIKRDAFRHQDGIRVPLVWQHQHNDPENVLGYAILHNHEDGVRTQGFFNDTPKGQIAKQQVEHGDVGFLSIYANKLKRKGGDVLNGMIREVSLVLAGANPGATIDNVKLVHGDGSYDYIDDEAVITTGLELWHEDDEGGTVATETKTLGDRTLKEIYDGMDEEEKGFVAAVVNSLTDDDQEADSQGEESEEKKEDLEHSEEGKEDDETIEHNDKEGTDMGRNVFDQNKEEGGSTLTHGQLSDFVNAVAADALKGQGATSLQEVMLAHADEYGITNIETLFPEAKNIDSHPEWITRKMEWVTKVLNGVAKRPFSRIKSQSADLTHEEARAKGYIKATLKKDQYFEIAGRETTPTTIYKKQKLDRDDIIDITDFDVVAWVWTEMRFMLNEEIARAILIGDGREVDDPDKINKLNIRPIALDDEFYTDVILVDTNISNKDLIKAVLRGRPRYKGVGRPTAFMTEDILTDLILEEDKLGRRLYTSEADLATALRVSEIVPVPVMEDAMRDEGQILIVLVNLSDYYVGTDKGGQISTFDQFDIDFNQHKYLIEGRMSGALVRHKTAQVVVRDAGTLVVPTTPGFNAETGVLTVPSVSGVQYYRVVIDGPDTLYTSGAQTAIASGVTIEVYAVPTEGYYFSPSVDEDWTFTRD